MPARPATPNTGSGRALLEAFARVHDGDSCPQCRRGLEGLMPARARYVEQVVDEYVAGRLELDELELHLEVAIVLDDGGGFSLALDPWSWPRYLRGADGRLLIEPLWLGDSATSRIERAEWLTTRLPVRDP